MRGVIGKVEPALERQTRIGSICETNRSGALESFDLGLRGWLALELADADEIFESSDDVIVRSNHEYPRLTGYARSERILPRSFTTPFCKRQHRGIHRATECRLG
jgi:hypothetical protein